MIRSRLAIPFAIVTLVLLVSPSTIIAKEYEIVYHDGPTYHVVIDFKIEILQAIMKEGIFRRMASSVCDAPPCTVKFWLSEDLAAKNPDITPEQKEAMTAEYLVTPSGVEMVYHHQVSKVDDVVAEAKCVKEVFKAYCLGGDVTSLPEPTSFESDGPVEARFYPEATIVTSFNGKVAEVTRLYDSMTWLKFISLRSKLEEIYGQPEDVSFYPSYADSPESKETAIRLGKGKASLLWEQDGWQVSLMWFESSSGLFYQHDALHRSMDAVSDDDGF